MSFGQTKEEAISKMQIDAEESSRFLPQSMGFFTMDKIVVVGNDYILSITIDEELIDYDESITFLQSNKSALASIMLGSDDQFAAIFKSSGLNLVYFIKGSLSGRETEIVLSAEVFADAPDKETGYNDLMKKAVVETKKTIPLDFGYGMTLTDVYLEDNYLCYKVKIDERTLTKFNSDKTEGTGIEYNMLKELAKVNDPIGASFLWILVNGNIGIKYVFWAEDAYEHVTFTLTPEMISSAVNQKNTDLTIGEEKDIEIEIVGYIEEAGEEEEAIPFQLVEEKPSFQGGDANTFSKWVNERLVYPEIAKEKGVQGSVTLRFTVEKDGSVTKVKVLRGVDPSLDKEAVRVVSMSPKWEPGKHNGRSVPVTGTFPVIFNL